MTGKVRIIGGQWRGRKLTVPVRPGLRPSSDRGRETLFNWLQQRIHGARCLDLFAGTGALGLEAASRGAAAVTLIERDRGLCAALRAIARDWPGGERLEVVQADVLGWLRTGLGPFDLVFVDPPFAAGLHLPALAALTRPGLLAPGAWVYVESNARSTAPVGDGTPNEGRPAEATGGWSLLRQKQIGAVRMQLLAADGHGLGSNPAASV